MIITTPNTTSQADAKRKRRVRYCTSRTRSRGSGAGKSADLHRHVSCELTTEQSGIVAEMGGNARDLERDLLVLPRGSLPDCASCHCPLQRRLCRAAHRAPANGDTTAHGQGGRVGAGAFRRWLVQAAQLDESTVFIARATWHL